MVAGTALPITWVLAVEVGLSPTRTTTLLWLGKLLGIGVILLLLIGANLFLLKRRFVTKVSA